MKSPMYSILITRFKAAAIKALFLLSVVVISLSFVFGADFWESKDYTKWTDRECAKLLDDSPWAQKLDLMRIGDLAGSEGGDAKMNRGNLGSSEGAGGQAYVRYFIQLQSALPIRQAQVRQMQIAKKYDSLSPEQKQAFDKSAEGFLSADYSDKVVVSISYSTNIQAIDLELARYWQSKTTAVFSNSIFLMSGKGDKVKVLDYKVAQGAQREFQFVFPRERDGNPIVTDQDKSLTLEFVYPNVNFSMSTVGGDAGDGRGLVEFKVKKMMIKGGAIY
jgi:hypothetical protein